MSGLVGKPENRFSSHKVGIINDKSQCRCRTYGDKNTLNIWSILKKYIHRNINYISKGR